MSTLFGKYALGNIYYMIIKKVYTHFLKIIK